MQQEQSKHRTVVLKLGLYVIVQTMQYVQKNDEIITNNQKQ